MSYLEAVILGLVQGLTEFLPVSSSGHLVIFKSLLGLKQPGITLEVFLHVCTLLAVLYVFRNDFIKLFQFYKYKDQRKFLLMLILGSIPTAFLGFLLSEYADKLFQSTLVVGCMLLITGTILKLLTVLPAGKKNLDSLDPTDALFVGLAQGIAIIPGISRSGATITGAMFRGLEPESAVRYSFMLSAPAIAGAALWEARHIVLSSVEKTMVINYAIGGVVAFLSGTLAIALFIKLLKGKKFHYFSYYCWGLGAITVIVSLAKLI